MKIEKIVSQQRAQLEERKQQKADLLDTTATDLAEFLRSLEELTSEIEALEQVIEILLDPLKTDQASVWLTEQIKTLQEQQQEIFNQTWLDLDQAVQEEQKLEMQIKELQDALLQPKDAGGAAVPLPPGLPLPPLPPLPPLLPLPPLPDGQKLAQYVPESEPEQEEPESHAACAVEGWIDSPENGPAVSLITQAPYAPSMFDWEF